MLATLSRTFFRPSRTMSITRRANRNTPRKGCRSQQEKVSSRCGPSGDGSPLLAVTQGLSKPIPKIACSFPAEPWFPHARAALPMERFSTPWSASGWQPRQYGHQDRTDHDPRVDLIEQFRCAGSRETARLVRAWTAVRGRRCREDTSSILARRPNQPFIEVSVSRHIFYSLHYEADRSRVELVRKIPGLTPNLEAKPGEWAAIQRSGDFAFKRWFEQQVRGRSCTVVLIGSETSRRPGVLYEIERSCALGLGVLGVHVHQLKDVHGKQSPKGESPFEPKLDPLVHVYDPPETDSKLAYRYIADNLARWIEAAVEARRKQS